MNSVLQLFNSWFKKPFDPNGDAVNWALFIGFVIILAIAWSRVIKHVLSSAETAI